MVKYWGVAKVLHMIDWFSGFLDSCTHYYYWCSLMQVLFGVQLWHIRTILGCKDLAWELTWECSDHVAKSTMGTHPGLGACLGH